MAMATRQWMVTHEWMVKPMHQKEWIERRGIMIWIAEVFSSLGSGLFLVSLFMNSWWGLLVGWLIIMFLKLPIHVAYFGKPWRFYQTIPAVFQCLEDLLVCPRRFIFDTLWCFCLCPNRGRSS